MFYDSPSLVKDGSQDVEKAQEIIEHQKPSFHRP